MDKNQFEELLNKALNDSYNDLNDETDRIIEEIISEHELDCEIIFSENEKEVYTSALRYCFLNQALLKSLLERLYCDE